MAFQLTSSEHLLHLKEHFRHNSCEIGKGHASAPSILTFLYSLFWGYPSNWAPRHKGPYPQGLAPGTAHRNPAEVRGVDV